MRYPRRLIVYENDRGIEMLRAIARRWDTTQAEAMRRLIREAARNMGITTEQDDVE